MGDKNLFDEKDWGRLERDWSAWWAGELDRPLVMFEGPGDPPAADLPHAPGFTAQLPIDMPAEEVVSLYQRHIESRRYYGDAWPKWWLNFGPGVAAAFLGSQVHVAWDTVWFKPLDCPDIADIHPRYDGNNPWLRRVKELTAVAVEKWDSRISVSFTDLGGNLDILASLRGTEQLLMDLYDSPGEVARLCGEITRLWLRYYDELDAIIRPAGCGTTPWAPIWSSGRCYMLQSDFCYMISPDMFERFVMPDIQACCDALDGGFYHLDGKGQLAHLDLLLSIERLRGVQWVPGDGQPPADQWLDVLKRIRDAGKLCQVSVSPEGARKIVRELGGRGFAIWVGLEPKNRREADEFLKSLLSIGRRS